METALTAACKIVYNGKDITADLAPYLKSATYTDRMTGESDELDITVADPDGRWRDKWYPDHGAEIQFEYGYAGSQLIPAGKFEIDEIEIEGPPDQVRIRALAAGLKRQARTRLGKAYENTTLTAIVNKVAKRLHARIVGTIESIAIAKASQYNETDWEFLIRICREYGYTVKLLDNNETLAITKIQDRAGSVVRTLKPSDVERWRYRDKITEVPAKTEVKHYSTRKKKLIKGTAPAGKIRKGKTSSDYRRRVAPARTPAQAKAIAQAEQDRHEIDKTALEITLQGDPKLVAGAAVNMVEFGKISGEYVITEARHSITSSGYRSNPTMKRVKD